MSGVLRIDGPSSAEHVTVRGSWIDWGIVLRIDGPSSAEHPPSGPSALHNEMGSDHPLRGLILE